MIGENLHMMKYLKSKKIYSKLFIGILLFYFVFIFSNQQTKLDAYSNEKDYYKQQIEELTNTKADLEDTLKNVNSTEYIEKVAREKLDMYYPYESIYIDISK